MLSHPESESSLCPVYPSWPCTQQLGWEEAYVDWVSGVHSSLRISSTNGGSDSKKSTCHAGDLGLIPGSGRFPGEGNGNPLQCSYLENLMDRGAWGGTTVHGITKSQT